MYWDRYIRRDNPRRIEPLDKPLDTYNMFYGRGSRDWRYCWVLAWFRRVRAVVRRVVGDVRR